jgi:SecD/SecF fusion protein
MRLPWASTLATTQSLASLLVQDPAPNQETEPAPVPSEAGQSDSAKQESTQQEPAKQEPIQQDQKAPAQETQPGAEAAQATPPGAERPSAQAPAVSGVERYLATTELKFAQPIARGALTEALIDAAAKTNQVTLTRDDIQLVAEGKDAEDLSVKSTVWKTTLQIGNKDDGKLILESFQSRYDGQPYFPTISGVGGQIAAETQWRALTAILLSLVIIVLYVWIRFQSVGFGVGAIIALVHDVLITLGAVALSYWLAPILGFAQVENFRVSLPVIASVLTLIGYSINDTIVVFDRIREVRGKRTELTPEMINLSVSQTLSRTIMTSALTWISVLVLYVWGGESIHGFAFCLVVGIVVGTYSSIFIASPIALWWINRSLKQKSQQKAAA